MWIYIWTCSMDTNMQNERRNLHAAWTWTSKGIKTWTRSMDMEMQHRPGHAAWTLSCSTDLNMHQGHGDAQRTCTWIMDLDTDHIHTSTVHAPCTWTCITDIFIHRGHWHRHRILLDRSDTLCLCKYVGEICGGKTPGFRGITKAGNYA
jgi:hypothetical protein